MSTGNFCRRIERKLAGMKLSELPTEDLKRALRDTERIAPKSESARILRRELLRRQQLRGSQNTREQKGEREGADG